jgi:GxxExxY protein
MTELLYKHEVYAIIGAAMEVYNQLGPGFLEAVYQEAMEIELAEREITFVTQPKIPIDYKGHRLKKFYIPDFIVYGRIVVELKAENCLTNVDEAQLLNQLKVTCMELGLLINFGASKNLDWRRRVNTKKLGNYPSFRNTGKKIGED